jgi:predicted kinase
LGLLTISTDAVRKRIAKIPATTRARAQYGEGIYTETVSHQTYKEMRNQASRWLRRDVSVVLDGSFHDANQRQHARRLAERCGADFRLVLVTCADQIRAARLSQRATDPAAISDADSAVARRMAEEFEFPGELSDVELLIDETGGNGADRIVAQLGDLTTRHQDAA